MANPKVIINDERRLFYCWGWDQWFALGKLGWKCFKGDCRYMYVPAGPHLRKGNLR